MTLHDLNVKGVHAHYGSAHVLFGVSLDVPAGTTVAVLGRNGAGKTTLMRSIMNAGVSTRGEIKYAGTSLRNLAPYRIARLGLQLVPEDRRIFTRLTVRENLRLSARASGDGRPARPLGEVTDLFPMLSPLMDRFGYALSGGEQQLLSIARAIVANPTLLLLDEPSEGLAPRIVTQVGEAIHRLRSELDLSVLLAEQNTRFALRLAGAVCLIDAGAVVWSGPAAEFRDKRELQQRYLAV